MFQEYTSKSGSWSFCYKSLVKVSYSVYRVPIFMAIVCTSGKNWPLKHLCEVGYSIPPPHPQTTEVNRFRPLSLKSHRESTAKLILLCPSENYSVIFFWQNCYLPRTGFFTVRHVKEVFTWTLSPGLISPIWEGMGCALDKPLFP